MRISEIELAAAKRQLARMREKQINAERENDPTLSEADRELIKKYPRHTLEAARLIDSTPLASGIPGNRDSFYLIREQETNCLHIKESHT